MTGEQARDEKLANVGQVYEFTLYGSGGAKKNRYQPHRGGMHIGSELKAELDNLEMQIPGDLRDLRLEHPGITFRFKYKNRRKDRDGTVTTILDLMKKCGVIVDDNVAHCNGRIVIEPAEICDEDSITVVLTGGGNDAR